MTGALDLAYDLRYASDHFTGIGTQAHGLLTALLAAPGDERWRVVVNPRLSYARRPIERFRTHPRVRWVETDAPPLAWTTALATGALLRHSGCAAYLSPFWLMPHRPGVPVVLTIHDLLPLLPDHPMSWWRRALFRRALADARGAGAILTVSRFSRDEIVRRTRIRGERVVVVPNGIAVDLVEPVRPPRAPDGPFALVVGVNRPHKNLATAAAAFAALPEPAPALVSAGEEDSRWPGLAALVPPGANAIALGRVSGAELEWLYRHATVVLLPTRYEGFGLPLLEAAARGRPVVAADIPSLREIGEGYARFVPPLEVVAWTRAIADAFADTAWRERARAEGPALAARYDYARCAERTLAVLREVAASRAPRAA